MDWRDNLKEIVGVTDEKDIIDLTDMEERELLGKEHLDYLDYIVDERTMKRTDSDVIERDSHI